MNKVYKSVWNESLGAWVAVSENSAARGKKASGKTGSSMGLSAIALASASLGLPSTAALAAENRAALFNDFNDGTCTAVYDGETQHNTGIYTGAACNPRLGNSGSAVSIGMSGGGSGTNGTNLISNQSGAFINGGLEVFGTSVASGSPAAYVHGGLSLFSDGTTSGTANKLIGVAAGTNPNDAVNLKQLTDGLTEAGSKYLSANDAASGPDGATAIGVGSIAIGGNAVANNSINSNAALAIGSDSRAITYSTVVGPGATATASNTVVLGTYSIGDRAGTVSVGSASNNRQIVNVAPGTQGTDVVNVNQLKSVTSLLGGGATLNADGTAKAPAYTVAGATANTVGDAVTKIDTALTSKVAYDSLDHSQVTLGGTAATAQVKLTNVKAADLSANSTDAVNGSQLNGTNQRVGSLETFETNINNGGGIKFFHSNSQLADSSATGANAVAIGGAAVASADNSVAIGANSAATRANTVSVGAAGKERQIVNVAAGTQGTDVVNVNQLQAVTTLLGGGATLNADGTVKAPVYTVAGATANTVGDAVTKIDTALTSKVAYDSTDKLQVTLGGVGAAKPTLLTNLKVGALASDSTDAVNGSQLFATNNRVTSVETFENDIKNGGGIKYFHTNSSQVDSSATGADSVAIGGAAKATANNSVALGSNSVADRKDAVSVGAAGSERQITNVAKGTTGTDAVNFQQLTDLSDSAVKYDTNTNGTPNYQSVTLGGKGATQPTLLTNLKAGALASDSTDAVNGSQLFSTNNRVTSLETFEGNINNGGGIKFFHTNSTLADSSATGTDAVAIGGAANASANNSVALGSNSVAGRANTVSVGSAGHERQITNVADGSQTTDAVNFGQLTTLANNVDTLGSFAVKYDTHEDGTPNYESITLGGVGAAQPTLLTNLKNGDLSATSTDAVNGSQLYATNQDVKALQNFTNNINNGGGITYFHTNSTLADSSAIGANSVAIGGAAVASGNNSVALGSNSVADRENSVSVGAVGSERQVTNVAAGTATTDAVNVGQLNAVSNTVTSLSASAIKYDNNADGTPDYNNVTLGNGNAAGTQIHNVAAATANMDAVNLGQFNDAIARVANAANNAYNPLFSADGSRDNEVATSSGTHSVASGANAMASGVNAIASGAGSVASGANAVAVGANASATASNSVALGAGSVADRANAVSVGTSAAGGQRQITNVEAGTSGTDAVNVNQMQQSVNTGVKSAKGYTDALRTDMNNGLSLANNHINSVGAMSSAMAMMAGSAAAISDKDNRFAAGTGVYRNKSAIAVGFQKRFGNNMVLTLGGSTTGEETTGGAGFAFGF